MKILAVMTAHMEQQRARPYEELQRNPGVYDVLAGQHVIPAYGSDTLLRLPFSGATDEDERRLLLQRVGDVYVSGDGLHGDERYAFLERQLRKLNATS